MDDDQAELHNALYRAATELLLPYFEPAGGKRPTAPSEVETTRRACALLVRAIAIWPANWNAQWVLGLAYRSILEYELSYDALRAAYELEQQNHDVGRDLSIGCLIVGRDDEAVDVASAVAARSPNDAGLVANLGLALFLAQRVNEAYDVVAHAFQMLPDDPVTGRLAPIVANVAADRFDDAEAMARHLVKLSPADPVTARVLKAVLVARGTA